MLVRLLRAAAVAALCVAALGTPTEALPHALRQTAGVGASSPFLMPYKYVADNFDWNGNVLSTFENRRLVDDMKQVGANAFTLAFATGECGQENWAGVSTNDLRNANLGTMQWGGIAFRLSTGGGGGTFTCGSQDGFDKFVSGWVNNGLVGVDFDIENGQSDDQVSNLVWRVKEGLAKYPQLTFTFTVATVGQSIQGTNYATPFPQGQAPDPFVGGAGATTLNKIISNLGFQKGNPGSWPDRVRINLMAMDYGSADNGACVMGGDNGKCQMGQTAIQAAYNLAGHWGVPMSGIELTPMIGDQDDSAGTFTTDDARAVVSWGKQNGLGGVHYWAWDRDTPCASPQPAGQSSDVCNMAQGVHEHSFIQAFMQSAQEADEKIALEKSQQKNQKAKIILTE